MESHPSTQLKVGIYLTAGLAVILGTIFFLGADKALFTSYIRLHSHFEQVQGLAVGSVVSLSGVVVGNVEDITFVPDKNFLDVKLKVNEKFLDRIREGSQVEIRTQGALEINSFISSQVTQEIQLSKKATSLRLQKQQT